MSTEFFLKQGDTGVPLRVVLSDSDGPIDLSAWAEVKLVMKRKGSIDEPTVDALATIDPDQEANPGLVTYAWAAEDVDTPNIYLAEFICINPAGDQVTFPRDAGEAAFLTIRIQRGLA